MTGSPGFPDPSARVAPLLAVADLDRALRFWAEMMGAAVEVRWDTYAELRLGEGRLHLAVTGDPPPDRPVRLVPPDDDGRAVGEVVVHVTDCAAVVARLQDRGVALLAPPSAPAWGGEVRAFLHDPDGHLVEITSPA